MISRIADWITIITAPLTALSTLAAGSGVLHQPQETGKQSSLTAIAVTLLITVIAWLFFFLGQARISVALSHKIDNEATLFILILVNMVALAVFVAVELIILDALRFSDPSTIAFWLAPSVASWFLGSVIVIKLIAAGAFGRPTHSSLQGR
ncbi:MAG: hypothetical protein HYX94_12480 [Chloroflexi bacterium]|nr:hypothetical protein [Chloroflexota bacterium]